LSKKIVYGCSKCDCVGIFHERDGTSCPDCGGYMNAIREAKYGEFVGVQREARKVKANIDQKLSYLDRLIKMLESNKAEHERINVLCNSIEQDLGISPADYEVIDTSTMDMPKGFIKVDRTLTQDEIMLFKDKGVLFKGAFYVCSSCGSRDGIHSRMCSAYKPNE